jgi:hypothetical protein
MIVVRVDALRELISTAEARADASKEDGEEISW